MKIRELPYSVQTFEDASNGAYWAVVFEEQPVVMTGEEAYANLLCDRLNEAFIRGWTLRVEEERRGEEA